MGTIWRLEAACRGVDEQVFFPIRESVGQYVEALTICQSCPVIAECLDLALRTKCLDGVFGGTTPAERRRMLNGELDPTIAAIGHGDAAGTPKGYAREKNRGLTPCDECREANNAYVRKQLAKYRAIAKSKKAGAVSVSV